jgi:serine/threonine-protein kinase
MLRDSFKNNRKPNASAPAGGSHAVSNASAEPRELPEVAASKVAADYAEDLQQRWQATFSKGRRTSDEAIVHTPTGLFELGSTLNGIYKIEAPLSKGGMGFVYRATHLIKNVPVVVKVMLHDFEPDDPSFIKFVQECKIALTIAHPNVVTIYDWGILTDTLTPYLVMEYLSGKSLRELLGSLKRLPVADAAILLAQACEGLDFVHKEEIIHRDLKPENIMVLWQEDGTPEGQTSVKILDFGIAQLHDGFDITDHGHVMGTLSYMSPEQIELKPLDLRCDIYAMGIVFYELITGRVPFRGKSIWQTMSMHVHDTYTPASQLISARQPDAIDAVINWCLAKDREQRYPSAQHLADDLFALAAAEQ